MKGKLKQRKIIYIDSLFIFVSDDIVSWRLYGISMCLLCCGDGGVVFIGVI